jgi:hypothetical protein
MSVKGRMGGEQPDHPSCSQNAHDETVLVRCAQGRTVRRLPLGGSEETEEEWEGGLLISCARGTRTIGMCSFDARSGRPDRPPSREENVSKLGGSIHIARCAQ